MSEFPIYIVMVEDHYYPSGGTYDWEFATGDLEKAKHYAQAKVSKYSTATVARVQRLSGGSIYYDALLEVYVSKNGEVVCESPSP